MLASWGMLKGVVYLSQARAASSMWGFILPPALHGEDATGLRALCTRCTVNCAFSSISAALWRFFQALWMCLCYHYTPISIMMHCKREKQVVNVSRQLASTVILKSLRLAFLGRLTLHVPISTQTGVPIVLTMLVCEVRAWRTRASSARLGVSLGL